MGKLKKRFAKKKKNASQQMPWFHVKIIFKDLKMF